MAEGKEHLRQELSQCRCHSRTVLAADAEAAITDYEGRGQGQRGRKPHLWRYHALRYSVVSVSSPKKRTRRGRPPKAEAPQVEVRYRLVVPQRERG